MAHLYIIEKILEVNELNSEMEKKIEEYEITTAYDIFLHSVYIYIYIKTIC